MFICEPSNISQIQNLIPNPTNIPLGPRLRPTPKPRPIHGRPGSGGWAGGRVVSQNADPVASKLRPPSPPLGCQLTLPPRQLSHLAGPQDHITQGWNIPFGEFPTSTHKLSQWDQHGPAKAQKSRMFINIDCRITSVYTSVYLDLTLFTLSGLLALIWMSSWLDASSNRNFINVC